MHILVTNDDGVQHPGLLALVQALRPLGKISVLAPDRNWSASGHVKTLNRPLRVRPVSLADGTPALSSDGAPSDCVALSMLGLIEGVDLVVSGINPFCNVGQDLTYSGTVTAALEAAVWKLPGLAISLDSRTGADEVSDYAAAAEIARRVVCQVMERGLPEGTALNVNVPAGPLDEIKGIEITRQGRRIYHDRLIRRSDPSGHPYYWIGGDIPEGHPDPGTDIGALAAGYVSITPLHLDLTAHHLADTLKPWIEQLEAK